MGTPACSGSCYHPNKTALAWQAAPAQHIVAQEATLAVGRKRGLARAWRTSGRGKRSMPLSRCQPRPNAACPVVQEAAYTRALAAGQAGLLRRPLHLIPPILQCKKVQRNAKSAKLRTRQPEEDGCVAALPHAAAGVEGQHAVPRQVPVEQREQGLLHAARVLGAQDDLRGDRQRQIIILSQCQEVGMACFMQPAHWEPRMTWRGGRRGEPATPAVGDTRCAICTLACGDTAHTIQCAQPAGALPAGTPSCLLEDADGQQWLLCFGWPCSHTKARQWQPDTHHFSLGEADSQRRLARHVAGEAVGGEGACMIV